MRILADTNVLLWWLEDHPRLAPYRGRLCDSGNEAWFSAVSIAEIAIKASLKKLTIPPTYTDRLLETGWQELAFSSTHAAALLDLPWHHRDPFDRMLIAQALTQGFPVMTADRVFSQYDIQVLQEVDQPCLTPQPTFQTVITSTRT